jgi:ABC-type polysaccharide/polyol phosphate export permease
MTFRLRDADATLRLFLTSFIMVMTVGYLIGLFFVEHTTSLSSEGIQEQFLGSGNTESDLEMRYAKSANEMYIFLHNHILSLSLVFFSLGGIFYFSSLVSGGLRKFLMVEPLLAVATTFGGIALVRFVSPLFSWLVLVSGTSLFLCYGVMVFLILKELWYRGDKRR